MCKLAVLFLYFAQAAAYSQMTLTTVTYKYPGGIVKVSFDPSSVSRQDLDDWMKLSPTLGAFNGFLVPESIDLCKAGDPRFSGCGQPHVKLDIHNADANLNDIRSRINELEKTSLPQDLMPVVRYSLELQEFSLERSEHELKFLSTGNMEILEQKVGSVNPGVECHTELDRIRASVTNPEQADPARFDWENCVWFAEKRKIGNYPESTWKSFLARRGIVEQVVEESPE